LAAFLGLWHPAAVVGHQVTRHDGSPSGFRIQINRAWSELGASGRTARTVFAARFRQLVGEPPMSYLARVRLGHAAGYLSTTDKTVRQIARLVGYENEASLSKAFRRAFGRAPGEYRRQQLAAHGVRATFAGAAPHGVDKLLAGHEVRV